MGYVFISYSTKNQKAADATRSLLSRRKIDTWMAPYDIPAGSSYAEVIPDALKNCACVVLLLTKDAQQSPWVSKEVERAINYRKTIVPLQLEDIMLNSTFQFFLCDQQIVSLPSVDENSPQMKKVLKVIAELAGVAGQSLPQEINMGDPVEAMKFLTTFFFENGIKIQGVKCNMRSPSVAEYTVEPEDGFNILFDRQMNHRNFSSVKNACGKVERDVVNVNLLTNKLAAQLRQGNATVHYLVRSNVFVVQAPLEYALAPEYTQYVQKFEGKSAELSIPLGVTADNVVEKAVLNSCPHILVGGDSARDISEFVKSAVTYVMDNYSPSEVSIRLFDGTGDLKVFDKAPNVYIANANKVSDLATSILDLTKEMESRYSLMLEASASGNICRCLADYNKTALKALPYIVFVINGYVPDKTLDQLLSKILTKSRAAGIYTLVAVGGEDVSKISGLVKANFICRIAFKCSDPKNSFVLTDSSEATQLIDGCDTLYVQPFTPAVRLQALSTDDKYIEKTIKRLNNPEEILRRSASRQESLEEEQLPLKTVDLLPEEVFADAMVKMASCNKATVSTLQRTLSIGFSKAVRIFEMMCQRGYTDKESGKLTIPPEDLEKYKKILSDTN